MFDVPLNDWSLETLQTIFGVPKSDPMYDCWTVKKEHVLALQAHVDSPIDLDRYDYFVSAYTEPIAL